MKLLAIDLFSGAGGLTEGMHKAGFKTKFAFEIDDIASKAYKANHRSTRVITKDIRSVDTAEIKKQLDGNTIHLLAGCPPCQGFSSIRRLNRARAVADERNSLITEYVRFVEELRPYTIMMENVPGLINYTLFKQAISTLKKLGYSIDFKVVNVKDYGVPQNRKRLVLVGSRLCLFAGLPFVFLSWHFLLAIIPVLFIAFNLAAYFKKWIGGYTGDCLGAIQQVSELAFYLSVIIIWRFVI